VFFDLFQFGVGSCAVEDIAVSVLGDGDRPSQKGETIF